jgi:hypothetical protein
MWFLAGFLALAVAGPILKEAGTSGGASAYGQVAALPAAVVSKFLDPTVPMFTKPTASSSTASSTASPSTTAANPATPSSSGNNLSKSSAIPQVPSPQEQP